MVLEFLQWLVMDALESFQSVLQNSIRKSRLIMQNQSSGFKMMREAAADHRHTQTVLERMDANDEAALEDFPLQDIIISTLTPQAVDEYCAPYISGSLDIQEVTSMDCVDPLAEILGKKLNTGAAIFRVKLALKALPASTSNGMSSFCTTVMPSFEDFDVAFNNLLAHYENMIATFGPLLKDSRIVPLISTSKYDFMTLLEEEESASTQECKAPWLPVQALLHDYAPYRVCNREIKTALEATLEYCCKQSAVSAQSFVCVQSK